MMRKKSLVSGFAAVALGLGVTGGCSSRAPQQQPVSAAAAAKPAPVAIKTVAAETRQVERAMNITGSLEPDETVSVTAEVPGRISKIYVDFGQSVRAGQVIAEFDKQELGLGLERSKAALAQALARVGLNPDQEDARPETSSSIRQVNAQMEDARTKYENAARLVKTGDISQERFTELEKGYQARRAALELAQDDLRMQLANIRALRADVKLAQKRLGDATVRAPFDGAVAQRLAAPGQYMKENTAIVSLVKTNPLRLKMDVPESASGSIRVGSTLTFTTDAIPNREFRAVVRELNPSLDSKSRSLTAEARPLETDPRLRPGVFVQVKLVTSASAPVVAVPKQALYSVAGLTKIFIVRGGRITELPVQPGQDLGDAVEVPGGQLQPGDRVATEKLNQLFNGTEVVSPRS